MEILHEKGTSLELQGTSVPQESQDVSQPGSGGIKSFLNMVFI